MMGILTKYRPGGAEDEMELALKLTSLFEGTVTLVQLLAGLC